MVMAIVQLVQTGMTSKIAAVAPIPVEKVKEIVIMTMNALAILSVEKIIVKSTSMMSGIIEPTAVMTLL